MIALFGFGIDVGEAELRILRTGPLVHRLLFVDDEPLSLAMSKEFFERRGFSVDLATSGPEAVALVRQAPSSYSAIIVDYQMEGYDGTETTEALLAINAALSVIIYSSDPNLDAFLKPHRRGARTYVNKTEEADVLLRVVREICKEHEERHQTVRDIGTAEEAERIISSIGMVGRSAALGKVAATVIKLRETDGAVLILGESGVGKELIAKALHHGRRGPIRAVNCADYLLNPQMARSELFGHTKGSFTGAIGDKKGILEEAGEGTVFLDEIDTLSIDSQVGLLRALESRTVMPVGSGKEVPIHCRIIASAKPNLLTRVAEGAFKQDLFHRISENILSVPTLAQRPDDLLPLVRHFCQQWSERYGSEKTFLTSTINVLERYPWPGNVRELRNAVYSTLNLTDKSKVGPSDLDGRFKLVSNTARPLVGGEAATLRKRLESSRKEHLIDALERSVSYREAARRLGVAPSTVLKDIARFGLDGERLLAAKRAKVGRGEK